MRLGDRERRFVVSAIAVAVVFTITAVVVSAVWPQKSHSGSKQSLWLFGFQTVRINPDHPADRETLKFSDFGQTMGSDGNVYLYDGPAGHLGMIDGRTNQLREFARVPTHFPPAVLEPAPSIAVAPGRLWLVTGPGTVRSFDLAAQSLGPTIVLTSQSPGETRVVVAGGDAIAVYRQADATFAARIHDGRVVARRAVASIHASDVVAASADGDTAWVIGAHVAAALDAATLSPRFHVDLAGAVPGGVGLGAGAGGDLWVVAQDRPEVDRVDPATGHVTARVAYLSINRGYRPPTQLVPSATDIWLFAPTGAQTDDHSAAVIEISLKDARRGTTIKTPSSLFVGGIALS